MKRTKALRRELKLRTKHNADITKLMAKMSNVAILKSETALLERMESNNNKYALLKEQASEFATRKEVETLTKMVYIGAGVFIAVELLLNYLK